MSLALVVRQTVEMLAMEGGIHGLPVAELCGRLDLPEEAQAALTDALAARDDIEIVAERGQMRARIRPSSSSSRQLLNIGHTYPLSKHEVRLCILTAIAKRRCEGYWQFQLSWDLGIDPRDVFHHVKALTRDGYLVRFALAIPSWARKRKDGTVMDHNAGSVASSSLIWLETYFDPLHMPRHVWDLLFASKLQPFTEKILSIISARPQGLMLESDLELLCLSFLSEEVSPVASMKSARSLYKRLRRRLLHDDKARRVKTWCPATERTETCICVNANAGTADQSVEPLIEMPEVAQHGGDLKEEDESKRSERAATFVEPSPADQIHNLVRSTACGGIFTPDIQSTSAIPKKMVEKVLVELEEAGLVAKEYHRQQGQQGNAAVFRFHAMDAAPRTKRAPALSGDAHDRKESGPAATITHQLQRRLRWCVQFIERECRSMPAAESGDVRRGRGVLITELQDVVGSMESSGMPDRKTVVKMLPSIQKILPTLKICQVKMNKSQAVRYVFLSDELSQSEADESAKQTLGFRKQAAQDAAQRRKGNLQGNLATGIVGVSLASSGPRKSTRRKRKQPDKLRFQQRVAQYYGYVSPAMLRLQLFHRAVLDLAREALFLSGYQEPATMEDTALRTENVFRNMTLDTFLQVLGYGSPLQWVEEYLVSSQPPMRMKEVPVFEIRSLLDPGGSSKQSREKYLSRISRLFSALCNLHLVSANESAQRVSWIIHRRVSLHRFSNDPHQPQTVIGSFDLWERTDFGRFWSTLQEESFRWISTKQPGVLQSVGSGSVETKTAEDAMAERRSEALARKKRKVDCPANVKLRYLFSKKNWKSQKCLDARRQVRRGRELKYFCCLPSVARQRLRGWQRAFPTCQVGSLKVSGEFLLRVPQLFLV
mmetsp:Transcript_52927/g.133019  ORF Transcript_52927/g.133019 Transcript_52927/m.133019 type:complete len:885 (-) Transcript_52927:4769-7423(-)